MSEPSRREQDVMAMTDMTTMSTRIKYTLSRFMESDIMIF